MAINQKIPNYYGQPQELHYEILKYMNLSDLPPLIYSSAQSFNIVKKNFQFWHLKYKKHSENKDLLVKSTKSFIAELKKKYINYYLTINGIEETRAELETNQVDITHIGRLENKIFVSSDDQTVKLFEICHNKANNTSSNFVYDYHIRKKKTIDRPKENETINDFDLLNGKITKNMFYGESNSDTIKSVLDLKTSYTQPKMANHIFSNTYSVFVGHQGGIWTFDHNDKYLVTGSTDKTVRIWSISNCVCVHILKGHRSTIRCLRIADDMIISGSRDSEIRVWDFNGDCLHVLRGHSLSVRCLDVKDRHLLTGSYDGSVILWDYKTGKKLKDLKRHIQRVYAVKITDNYIISSGQCSNIYVSDRNGNLKHVLKEHKSVVVWLEIIGAFLLSAGADGNIIKWNLNSGEKEYQILERKHTTALKYYNGCVIIATNQSLNMYDFRSGRFVKCLLCNCEAINTLHFDQCGILIGCKKDGKTKIVSITYKQIQ